jgi:hypothetical protein
MSKQQVSRSKPELGEAPSAESGKRKLRFQVRELPTPTSPDSFVYTACTCGFTSPRKQAVEVP